MAGYEAMVRLGLALGPGHYARFHPTATCGALGAAVGAGVAMELGPAALAGAIGTALSMAGGLWQARHEPVLTKHLHVAEASRRGFLAARLAAANLPGPLTILEGAQGFFAGLAPEGVPGRVLAPRPAPAMAEVSFKPWPACRHAHPAIDATRALARARGGGPVVEALVETYADAIRFCDRMAPQTDGEARFSLQHAVAVAILAETPALADFTASACTDPAYATLRERVRLRADPDLTLAYPAHFGARVSLTLADGRHLSHRVTDAWGDPEWPLHEADVMAKFRALAAAAGLTPSVIERFAAQALTPAEWPALRLDLARLTLTTEGLA